MESAVERSAKRAVELMAENEKYTADHASQKYTGVDRVDVEGIAQAVLQLERLGEKLVAALQTQESEPCDTAIS